MTTHTDQAMTYTSILELDIKKPLFDLCSLSHLIRCFRTPKAFYLPSDLVRWAQIPNKQAHLPIPASGLAKLYFSRGESGEEYMEYTGCLLGHEIFVQWY